MNDFQAINDIVNESVRNSSYIAVVISSSVFIIYTIIVKLIDYFKQKGKQKPLLEMAAALRENTANIVKLNGVLDKTLKDAERKESRQCENAIKLGFGSLSFTLLQHCTATIAHNNINDNKKLIIDNIKKLVSGEYYKLYATLSMYEIDEVNVASKLDESWIKEIADTLVAIIYNGQDEITRITQLNNRLNIYCNEYSTFINNKIFNT